MAEADAFGGGDCSRVPSVPCWGAFANLFAATEALFAATLVARLVRQSCQAVAADAKADAFGGGDGFHTVRD